MPTPLAGPYGRGGGGSLAGPTSMALPPPAPGTPAYYDLAILAAEEYRLLDSAKEKIRRELDALKARASGGRRWTAPWPSLMARRCLGWSGARHAAGRAAHPGRPSTARRHTVWPDPRGAFRAALRPAFGAFLADRASHAPAPFLALTRRLQSVSPVHPTVPSWAKEEGASPSHAAPPPLTAGLPLAHGGPAQFAPAGRPTSLLSPLASRPPIALRHRLGVGSSLGSELEYPHAEDEEGVGGGLGGGLASDDDGAPHPHHSVPLDLDVPHFGRSLSGGVGAGLPPEDEDYAGGAADAGAHFGDLAALLHSAGILASPYMRFDGMSQPAAETASPVASQPPLFARPSYRRPGQRADGTSRGYHGADGHGSGPGEEEEEALHGALRVPPITPTAYPPPAGASGRHEATLDEDGEDQSDAEDADASLADLESSAFQRLRARVRAAVATFGDDDDDDVDEGGDDG